jgi:hypothetical protein
MNTTQLELEITYRLCLDGNELARGTRLIPVESNDRVLLIDARSVIASRAERIAAERDAIVVRPDIAPQ